LAVEGFHVRDWILLSPPERCTPEQTAPLPSKADWRKVSDCRTGQQ
jgi:hypothetical protein